MIRIRKYKVGCCGSGWCVGDYVAALRFPFLRGPSLTKAKAASADADAVFFVLRLRLRKRAFDASPENKKSAIRRLRFCFGRDSVGIRQNHGKSGEIRRFTGFVNLVQIIVYQ